MRNPDGPILNRSASSMTIRAARVRSCFDAYRLKDEPALRAELQYLAPEAEMLAGQPVIVGGKRARRMRVAAERDRAARAGTS
jgi:hypothetical protein